MLPLMRLTQRGTAVLLSLCLLLASADFAGAMTVKMAIPPSPPQTNSLFGYEALDVVHTQQLDVREFLSPPARAVIARWTASEGALSQAVNALHRLNMETAQAPHFIGPYQVLEEISAWGGFAKVYLAFDPKTPDIWVAVKVANGTKNSDAHLKHDAAVLAALNGRSIYRLIDIALKFFQRIRGMGRAADPPAERAFPQFIDYGVNADGQPYLAMEFLEGYYPLIAFAWDMKQKGRTFTMAALLNLDRKILEAVQKIHEKGFVHKDLRPANILFRIAENGDLSVKIIDFGMASSVRSPGRRDTEGLPEITKYVPPEMHKDNPWLGFPSDIYSLGVIFFESYLQSIAMDSPDDLTPEQFQKLLSEHLELPKIFRSVLRKATAQIPAERYATAGDMKEALLGYPAVSRTRRRTSSRLDRGT